MDNALASHLSEIAKVNVNIYHKFTKKATKKMFDYLIKQSENTCYYFNQNIVKYLAIAEWQNKKISSIVVLGPFLSNSDLKIYNIASKSKRIQNELSSLPILNKSEINSITSITASLINCGEAKVHMETDFQDDSHIVQDSGDLDDNFEQQVNERYKKQRELIDAIIDGNAKQADILTDGTPTSFFSPFVSRVPSSPLRSAKNIGFAYNTMCRIGAEQGGLEPVYVHLISEKYAIKIEQARDLNSIWHLIRTMAQEYCDLISDLHNKHYGRLVSATISYVNMHYSQQLTLTQIAHAVHSNLSVLSRNFSKETGQSLFEFINFQRIEFAKQLIRTENSKMNEIAINVGFNGQSYFAQCFKKIVGMSPSEYAKSRDLGHDLDAE